MKSTAYSRWASFFKSMCGKFSLKSHIDGTVAPHPQDLDWDQADCYVRSSFFSSVDDSVLDLAMTDDNQTSQDLWLSIKGLFRANKQSWAIFLSHDFHSKTQGDSSIAEYCSRMKTLTDALRDVGHPIQDSQLVLNLLRGLNPRFSNTANDIANSIAGFTSFAQAWDMLAMKELRLANEEKISNSTVLLAGNSLSSPSSGCASGCRSPSGFVQTGGGGSNSSSGRGSCSGGKKK
ncbi:uncharacterized protein [Setaria viridis]|uniref:uncharacterized protein n=1 Tax=Setaria viridis TaxID=4556 RepID=UPI0014938A4B|nr:uncharacterized protein LOC117835639 [Setaria viridis]